MSLLINKSNITAILGNVLEWYDFCLYGYFAPLLAQAFFPGHNIYISLMYVFITFASGYIMRPIGGLVFGHMGDSIGHGYALYYAICLIALPTFLIGLIPSYVQIGVWAPALLIIIRMLQGLSAGGQYSGSLTFLRAQTHKKGAQAVSFAYIGSLGGYLLASFIGIFSTKFFNSNLAWRIPFLITIFFIPLLRYCKTDLIRMKKLMSPDVMPIMLLRKEHKLTMVKTLLLASIGGIYYSSFFIFLITYMNVHAGISMSNALLINTFCLISSGLTILFFAKLADRYGRKPVMLFSSLVLALAIYPALQLISTGFFLSSLFGVWLLTTCNTAFMAACAVVYVELFSPNVQFTGSGICYNLGAGVVGGFTPFCLTFLLHNFGSHVMSEALICSALLAVILILFSIPETMPVYGD